MLCQLLMLALALVVLYHAVTWALSCLKVGDYGNKHVLITGCDSGFGQLLAKRLDGMGFNVFAACLTSSAAEVLHMTCSDRVTTLLLDVTEEKSIASAREFVEKRLPNGVGLWGVVNNAGVAGPTAPSEWLSRKDYVNCLSVNLFGLIDVTRTFLPLVRRARGRVVNIASTLGRIALPPAPYSVSKYGVEAYSDCLRREVYAQGVKVCLLEPGYFKTNIISASTLLAEFRKQYDATPEDIRQHYPHVTLERYPRLVELVRERSSDNLDLVVDAYVKALTSRFPPTRQLVGMDVRLGYRLLWNIPTPLTDWLISRQMTSNAQRVK